MKTSFIAVLCLLAVTQATQASDMAIVDAVTGNQQAGMSGVQRATSSSQSASMRKPSKAISKFDYTAQEKAKAMGCVDNRNPGIEPSTSGGEILVFRCGDGRELRLHCASGVECTPQ